MGQVEEFNREETNKSVGVNEIGQRIVRLKAISRSYLHSTMDKALMRVFYWAAFYGYNDTVVDYMILHKRWSPYIKSFKRQSVLTAAIRGKRVTLVRLMSDFKFVAAPDEGVAFSDMVMVPITNMFNKDSSGLNPLHYAYLYDLPEVR